MHVFLKPRSRTVVHHYHEQEQGCKSCVGSDDEELATPSISLTVWRKSLVFSCKGFTVIGNGNLVYRVDNYTSHPDQTILMDASGNSIFTIRRRNKKLRIVDNYWLVYEGEVGKNSTSSSKKPIFCVRKNISIVKTKPSILAYVYGLSGKGSKYTIEGSYARRSCKIMDESRRAFSEIKMKEALIGSGASFGVEVFDLVVQSGFDSRFAMAIVLLLDQMFS